MDNQRRRPIYNLQKTKYDIVLNDGTRLKIMKIKFSRYFNPKIKYCTVTETSNLKILDKYYGKINTLVL